MAQGKRQQTDSGTHRIYTSNKAPGLGRASSPISVMMGLKRHRFLQGSGTLSGTNSYPALSDRRALSLLQNTLQPGVRGLALADARAGHPLLDPPAPDMPIQPLGARRRVCRCSRLPQGARSPSRPAAGLAAPAGPQRLPRPPSSASLPSCPRGPRPPTPPVSPLRRRPSPLGLLRGSSGSSSSTQKEVTPRRLSSLPLWARVGGGGVVSGTASAQKVPVPLRGSEAAGLEPSAEGRLFRADRSTGASEARAKLALPCTAPFLVLICLVQVLQRARLCHSNTAPPSLSLCLLFPIKQLQFCPRQILFKS